MQTATPRVSGFLSPEQIMRVVRRNQAAVRYCYENELQRQPSLHGRIEIAWRVARNGTVSSARVGSTTTSCAVRWSRRIRIRRARRFCMNRTGTTRSLSVSS